MLIVLDGKYLMQVCEVQYNRLKTRQRVEIVYSQTETTVYTRDNAYSKKELK
jgi:hypothetical protein